MDQSLTHDYTKNWNQQNKIVANNNAKDSFDIAFVSCRKAMGLIYFNFCLKTNL